MHYRELAPGPGLAPWIVSYFVFQVPAGRPEAEIAHTILPDGGISLVFHHNPRTPGHRWCRITGPRTQNLKTPVFPGSTYFGCRFRPGVAGTLLGLDAGTLLNEIVDAAELLPELPRDAVWAAVDREADVLTALEEAMCATLPAGVAPDEWVLRAAHEIAAARGNLRIGALVDRIPLSERQLQKRFRREVGLNMKSFARICRLRATVIDIVLGRQKQLDALFNAGYFDQAHFINDFSMVSGITPSLFYHYVRQIDSSLLDN